MPEQLKAAALVQRLRCGVYGINRIAICAEAADFIEAQALRAALAADAVPTEREGWRWVRLANDRERMLRMGNLQDQQDYILGRARLADAKRGRLLRAWWAYMETDDYSSNPALFNDVAERLP